CTGSGCPAARPPPPTRVGSTHCLRCARRRPRRPPRSPGLRASPGTWLEATPRHAARAGSDLDVGEVIRAVAQHLHDHAARAQRGDRAGLLVEPPTEGVAVRHDEHITALEAPEGALEPLLPGLVRLGSRMPEVVNRYAEPREVGALLDDRRQVVARHDEPNEARALGPRTPPLAVALQLHEAFRAAAQRVFVRARRRDTVSRRVHTDHRLFRSASIVAVRRRPWAWPRAVVAGRRLSAAARPRSPVRGRAGSHRARAPTRMP